MGMGAQEAVGVPMLALAEQVDVKIVQLRSEGVGIDMAMASTGLV